MPQLRQNIITGDWVVIAPERSKRPQDFVRAEAEKPALKKDCVFCPDGRVYHEQSIKNFETERVYVIPNNYPAFLEDPHQASPRQAPAEGFYTARSATGGHDVIIMKDHEQNLLAMSPSSLNDLLHVAQRRYQYWRHDRAVNYSMLIYNHGPAAGASIAHPHAQLFASNIIPNHINRELDGAKRYYDSHGACVFCDVVAHEQHQKIRVIEETDHFIAFTFYAARFPFETWIVPKNHIAVFEQESPAKITGLSEIMHRVLARLNRVLSQPSLNFYIHDAPPHDDHHHQYHWHLEIMPRATTQGGFELGSGVYIDVLSPEESANHLTAS